MCSKWLGDDTNHEAQQDEKRGELVSMKVRKFEVSKLTV
jgi:hypothetical protein